MRRNILIVIFAVVACSCTRPSSMEPFVTREEAEYGDTYSFVLDMADSTVSYGLDFYARLERKAFGTFPEDSLILAIRWIAPSDSNYVDTLVMPVGTAVGKTYFTKDIVCPFKERLDMPEYGEWRLKARVLGEASSSVRGVGIIFTRK